MNFLDTTFSVKSEEEIMSLEANINEDGFEDARERTILVGLDSDLSEGWDMEETMIELKSLVETAGGVVVAEVVQRRQRPDPAYFIGKGKAKEVEIMRQISNATLIVFNDELSPAQVRNLEENINGKVIDRTQLILDIFAQRAQTAEGKLQVELALLQYLLPRLSGKGLELSRLGGGSGIGTRRGPGETKLEVDKRVIKTQIASIREQLEEVKKRRGVQRSRRVESNIPVISLVGYTNAGKSSLLNKLTGSDVFVEDKLFATLDPVTRRIELPNNQEALLTDTVGFIQKLPHQVVAAFRATLEEVSEADALIHVVDSQHPKAEEHCAAVYAVLRELNAASKPIITVFNKMDLEGADAMATKLAHEYPLSVCVSTLTGWGIDKLLVKIEEILSEKRRIIEVLLPYGNSMISMIHDNGKVLNQSFVQEGVLIKAEVDKMLADRIDRSIEQNK